MPTFLLPSNQEKNRMIYHWYKAFGVFLAFCFALNLKLAK